ncbi:MAG: hypothetical protein R3D98_01295 [Candidatus Krumholzibacteriia bacterium]
MNRQAQPWQELDADQVVTWSPAEPPRAIEGPLALEMFRGRLLTLDLAPGQIAVHVVDGRTRRVYLEGHQELDLTAGPGAATCEGWLVFVRIDAPISWRWDESTRLHLTARTGETGLPLRGACSVLVADPLHFHDAVVAGLDTLPATRLAQVLETLVRSNLESRLQELMASQGLDPLRAKVMLESLQPADLDDDLQPLGLACSHLAVAVPVASEDVTVAADETPVACYDDVF